MIRQELCFKLEHRRSPMHLGAKPIATPTGGRARSIELLFHDGIHACETVPFDRPDGAELFLDVDKQDTPIPMQIVESLDPLLSGQGNL